MPKYTLAVPLLALGVLPVLLGSFESYLAGRKDLSAGLDNLLARLEFFRSRVLDDGSALERVQVLEAGLDLFLDQPHLRRRCRCNGSVVATSQHTQPACHARCRVRCLRDSAMDVVSRDPMEGKVLSGEGVSSMLRLPDSSSCRCLRITFSITSTGSLHLHSFPGNEGHETDRHNHRNRRRWGGNNAAKGSHATFAGLQAARNFDDPGRPNRRNNFAHLVSRWKA